jgi:hypothetical protein
MPAELARQQAEDQPYDSAGYFDLVSIANVPGAKPAPGDEGILIGPAGAGGAGEPNKPFPRIPRDARGHIYEFTPILYGAIGPISGWIVPGAGVSVRWRVSINNVPRYPYDNWTTLGIARSPGGRPLLELNPNDLFSVEALIIDPAGLYEKIGVRILGRVFTNRQRRRR